MSEIKVLGDEHNTLGHRHLRVEVDGYKFKVAVCHVGAARSPYNATSNRGYHAHPYLIHVSGMGSTAVSNGTGKNAPRGSMEVFGTVNLRVDAYDRNGFRDLPSYVAARDDWRMHKIFHWGKMPMMSEQQWATFHDNVIRPLYEWAWKLTEGLPPSVSQEAVNNLNTARARATRALANYESAQAEWLQRLDEVFAEEEVVAAWFAARGLPAPTQASVVDASPITT